MTRHPNEGQEIFLKLRNVVDRFLTVNLSYLGAIPYDDLLRSAVKARKAVLEQYPRAKSSLAFNEIAKTIGNWMPSARIDGKISFFFEKLIHSGKLHEDITR
jgi:flagellar biosynthesis protein FlhG